MNVMRELVMMGDVGPGTFNIGQALASFLLAFVLGQSAAWVYIYTHQGLSYSRAFVQSIVILTMVVCMAMMVIGSNIVIAFGLIGALSVIRFRNILKDTRDTAFIFFALITGMGTGTYNYRLSILSALVFCVLLCYLHWSRFGGRLTCDGFLRFNLEGSEAGLDPIRGLLARHCRSSQLVSQRFHDEGMGEVAYRLIMRDPRKCDRMVQELSAVGGVSNITFVAQEEQAEV
ncbi:DUF4956 domain-containing protein [Candidatus Sumerlaeota bacterium]|nr:DUF4956 domain-containing protein [Candidatus Sumerlaeota bacterium]